MAYNYDSSQVGVPYVRVNKISLTYAANGKASAICTQALAVKLSSGEIMEVGNIEDLKIDLDLALNGADLIPMVDATTGAALGTNTSLNQVMLGILAVIRQKQVS